jgi:hypothetical protein
MLRADGGGSAGRVGDRVPRTCATGDGGGGTFSCNGERSGVVKQIVGQGRGGSRRELAASG